MDGILVVFYSYTGTSRRLVQLLCSQLGWPSGEIVEERTRSGASGTLRCMADSLLRRQPRIRYQGPDPRDFGTVVLVSPIWAYRLASPMRRRPMRNPAVPASPQLISPSSLWPGVIAFSGQMAMQPPQPWHISGKVKISCDMTLMALNWQRSEQARQ